MSLLFLPLVVVVFLCVSLIVPSGKPGFGSFVESLFYGLERSGVAPGLFESTMEWSHQAGLSISAERSFDESRDGVQSGQSPMVCAGKNTADVVRCARRIRLHCGHDNFPLVSKAFAGHDI